MARLDRESGGHRAGRRARASLFAILCIVAGLGAQEPPSPKGKGDPQKVDRAIEKWLGSTHDSAELLAATVEAVLADENYGLARLGGLLREASREPDQPRSRGTRQLATRVALAFLQRESSAKVAYAGQYLPLEPLKPFVTDLFFQWLIDTPDWFPDTHRITLVPALRDLQPTLPSTEKLEGVIEIVENVTIEPLSLRQSLACMLWQWGKKEYVAPRLEALRKAMTEDDLYDRARALHELADLQYVLRDYAASARSYRALESLTAHSDDYELKPVDWYAAACVYALAGDVERGLAALAKCAEQQADPGVDSSHKVEPEVFDADPEIDALRGDERFAALVAKAKAMGKNEGKSAGDPPSPKKR